ncbi:MAG TPA: Maf family protein [Anaerolineaceae bacterium]|mgnify:CR=1 FL=1|nr:Maf family protein [Anaerolineaceae bacterium]HPN52239.1 Maf family protein [Anaerolineaceae bacterium]
MNDFDLILASNSPRRAQLLGLTGLRFIIRPANIDESRLPGEHPAPHVLRLAGEKARAAAAGADGPLVLASDTIVVDGEDILGKPRGAQDARRMLMQLRGRTHQVFTAVAISDPATHREQVDLCVTDVPMRFYSDAEMDAYIASGDPFDKAGAYAIQHAGFHPVEKMTGCFASVMGLPLCHVLRLLQAFGLAAGSDVPAACQQTLAYDCPVYQAILKGESIR